MTIGLRRAISRILGNERPREPIQIVVWGKPDCSLCDQAHAILDKLSHEYAIVVTTKDVRSDPVALNRYQYMIPVVEIAGTPRLQGKVTEHWLRQELDDAAKP
ncbi:MAG TPA: glutaredoxin family protein [Chloroflexota bacterium]|nr:glutaredoxin family protein [Chloroflexota bacterium]